MALHGDVRVTGRLVVRWSAQRLTPLTGEPGETHTYACAVHHVDGNDGTTVSYRTFELDHRYAAGAAALAAAVLTHSTPEGT